MADWKHQFETLIAPAVAASQATQAVLIDRGVIGQVGTVAASLGEQHRALLCADEAGFAAAGPAVRDALAAAGFTVQPLVLPVVPLPKASVNEACPFLNALAADPGLMPVSVGSGVINDLVKFAAFETGRRYVSVATAASMDGYTSAGAPLARDGFKVTIPTRAPIALIADLDVIARAPADMTGWGYGDLAGKSPAGGDWILADLAGVEPIDTVAYPMVQDNLRGWLADPAALAAGDFDAAARLFIGLTAVGFAMEFHATSRPASGADHQIAHMWEMEGLEHDGRKVSHGAAVAVGCSVALALFDWLLAQDLGALDPVALVAARPGIAATLAEIDRHIPDPRIAARARIETEAKQVSPVALTERLETIRAGWPQARARLGAHLYRQPEMVALLRAAGAPAIARDIGVDPAHLERTIRAARFIRRRYTILDFLDDTGLFDTALSAILNPSRREGAAP